jgi:hypothetical protein
VFDFDYDKIIDFDWSFTKCQWCLNPTIFLFGSLCCYPCYAYKNIVWATRAQHVAIHRDGIKFVNDKRSSGCGFSCQDQGKNSKTVPFDKLTDCDVSEPAGTAICCFIPNVLSFVTVDTASSGQMAHELVLRGLKDPHGFKKCVWDCKRSIKENTVMDDVGASVAATNYDAAVPLLREIRDELKLQTTILQSQAQIN